MLNRLPRRESIKYEIEPIVLTMRLDIIQNMLEEGVSSETTIEPTSGSFTPATACSIMNLISDNEL